MTVQWEGDKKTLILLREIFRRRMREVDFCIGEDRVEELFTALLNEPAQVEIVSTACSHSNIKQMILDEIEALIPKIHKIFNRNGDYYMRLKKK